MKRKYYSDEELISELKRFYNENGRIPKQVDMQIKFDYPSAGAYRNRFGSHNSALKVAGFEPNQKHQIGTLDGTETCSYCGRRADEIPTFKGWVYPNGIRYCRKHGQDQDYIIGNLDINSNVGLGRAGEILVVKTLKIGNEHDCNRISCGYHIDMYHKDYGRIDVKTALFSYEYNKWHLNFPNKLEIKTFICIGLSSDRSIVEHVWVVPNKGEIRNKPSLQIYNTYHSLLKYSKYEVNSKPYNDIWKTMKLKTCDKMTDKNKENYVEPMKISKVINNVVKQVEQVTDTFQYKLIDYI